MKASWYADFKKDIRRSVSLNYGCR